MSKADSSAASICAISSSPKPIARSALVRERRPDAFQRAVADGIGDDVVDLRLAVAERAAALPARSG